MDERLDLPDLEQLCYIQSRLTDLKRREMERCWLSQQASVEALMLLQTVKLLPPLHSGGNSRRTLHRQNSAPPLQAPSSPPAVHSAPPDDPQLLIQANDECLDARLASLEAHRAGRRAVADHAQMEAALLALLSTLTEALASCRDEPSRQDEAPPAALSSDESAAALGVMRRARAHIHKSIVNDSSLSRAPFTGLRKLVGDLNDETMNRVVGVKPSSQMERPAVSQLQAALPIASSQLEVAALVSSSSLLPLMSRSMSASAQSSAGYLGSAAALANAPLSFAGLQSTSSSSSSSMPSSSGAFANGAPSSIASSSSVSLSAMGFQASVSGSSQDLSSLDSSTEQFALDIIVEDAKTVGSGFGTFTQYRCIAVRNPGPNLVASRRYNDFVRLRDMIVEKTPSTRDVLPKLPEKKVIGKFKQSFIQKRKQGLEVFLRFVVTHPWVCDQSLLSLWFKRSFSEIDEKEAE